MSKEELSGDEMARKELFRKNFVKEFVNYNYETKRIDTIIGWFRETLEVGDVVLKQSIDPKGNVYCLKDRIVKITKNNYYTESDRRILKMFGYYITES